MKKWILKAIVQKSISYFPFSHRINYLFQKHVTKGVFLTDEYFYDRLSHASKHFKSYYNYAGIFPEKCLEIGTGWYPIVPISFFLAGVNKVYSVDISFLTSKQRIKITLEKFIESYKLGFLPEYINIQSERFSSIQNILENIKKLSLNEILTKLHITYLIEDAGNLSLADNSIDLINSNNTFEHIYPDKLIPILKEFKRVLNKESGVMSHFIDLSDHFAHFDKSINIYNFLKFSDTQWKWIDNSIQPQNRLRIYDYKKIYADLNIPIDEESFRKGDLKELNKINLDKKYLNHPISDLAITHCHFVSIFK